MKAEIDCVSGEPVVGWNKDYYRPKELNTVYEEVRCFPSVSSECHQNQKHAESISDRTRAKNYKNNGEIEAKIRSGKDFMRGKK